MGILQEINRPVTLVSVVGKLLEEKFRDRIYMYLEKHGFIIIA